MDIKVPEIEINYDYAIELLISGEAKDKVKGWYKWFLITLWQLSLWHRESAQVIYHTITFFSQCSCSALFSQLIASVSLFGEFTQLPCLGNAKRSPSLSPPANKLFYHPFNYFSWHNYHNIESKTLGSYFKTVDFQSQWIIWLLIWILLSNHIAY